MDSLKKIFSIVKAIFSLFSHLSKKIFFQKKIIFINPKHNVIKRKISFGFISFFLIFFSSLVMLNFIFLPHEKLANEIKVVKEKELRNEEKVSGYENYLSTLVDQQNVFKKELSFANDIIQSQEQPSCSSPASILTPTSAQNKTSFTGQADFKKNLNSTYFDLLCNLKSIEALEKYQFVKKNFIGQIPNGWPLKNNVGYKTSGFGLRPSIADSSEPEFHYGVDIASYPRTEIIASADGIVTFSGVKGGYGNVIVINHNYNFKTVYAHNEVNLVKVNQIVKKNQVIALLGNTGRSTGYHLHYEIIAENKLIDPWPYIISKF